MTQMTMLAVAALATSSFAGVAPHGLAVERLESPVGIDAAVPRLSWKLPEGFVRQAAYEIDAGVWKTGRVESRQSVDVEWNGPALASSQRVSWRVRVWDADGRASDWSEPSLFVMGVMKPGDWRARWIGPAASTRPDEDMAGAEWITAEPDAKGTVTLRRRFTFDGCRPGEFVELVHAAHPQHEVKINGEKFHFYRGHVHRWNFLQFKDVTKWLRKGENEIEVTVKEWEGNPGERAFIAKLAFPGGRTVVTDGSWSGKGGVRTLGKAKEPAFAAPLVMRTETASPAFAKDFTVARKVAKATLHITGLGFYEAYLNGKKIGDKVLDPSPTDYDDRVLYSTYVLDGEVKEGANRLEVLVGHGWYDVRSIAVWDWSTAPWRDFPRMIAQLEIEYADGGRSVVASDGTWSQIESPVAYDCIREGEVIDRNGGRLPPGLAAEEVPAPKGRLQAAAIPASKVMAEFSPESVSALGEGEWRVKFPVDVSGWIKLEVEGQKKGDVVTVRYDERTDPVRRIAEHFRYTASHRTCAKDAAFQTDRLICTGAPVEIYEPRFTYNGFRYVTLRGLRRPPKRVVARFVHTSFRSIGSFDSSDGTLNTLVAMAARAYKCNFADGYPTDCPHREKNGWTGDASIASELAQYLFENTAAYEKWLRDICDSQKENGDICCIVPTAGWGFKWGNGPGWDSALPVIAWNLYCYRDDRRILDAVYPALKKYLEYTATRENGEGLVRHGLGDWVPVNRKHMPSVEYTSSCYYLQALSIASRIAAVKGAHAEGAAFEERAQRVRRAVNAKYYKGEGVYDNGGQTAQAMAVTFALAEPGEREKVSAKLVESVERTECHLDVGLFGTKHIFRALSRIGRTDLAYRVLVNPTSPSMVDWLRKGGTTLWEDWKDGSSRNHIMFGDFAGWAYQYLAGIRLPETEKSTSAVPDVSARGFREIVLAPCPVDGLARLSAAVDTPYGMVRSGWRTEDGKLVYEFEVPPGVEATLRLPGRADEKVSAGKLERRQ